MTGGEGMSATKTVGATRGGGRWSLCRGWCGGWRRPSHGGRSCGGSSRTGPDSRGGGAICCLVELVVVVEVFPDCSLPPPDVSPLLLVVHPELEPVADLIEDIKVWLVVVQRSGRRLVWADLLLLIVLACGCSCKRRRERLR